MMSNDPITLEIIQNALTATADEMFAAMGKTAMSSIIYEVLDMGSGITDAEGRIASSGCLLYTSPSPRDATLSRMPSSA